MGEFKNITFSVYGTEIDYLQGLIDLISDVLGVPCNTTAAAQFEDRTAQPTFIFNLNNNTQLKLLRNRVGSEYSEDYTIYINSNGVSQNIMVKGGGVAPGYVDTVTTRAMGVAYYKSEDLKIFWFNAHQNTFFGYL